MDRGGDKEERKGAPLRTKLGSARGIINQRAGGAGLFKPPSHRNHHHLDYDDYEFLYSPLPPPFFFFILSSRKRQSPRGDSREINRGTRSIRNAFNRRPKTYISSPVFCSRPILIDTFHYSYKFQSF